MNVPGKLREDLHRIYGSDDPLGYIEDIRAETNPGTQQEELVVRLRVPRHCERYLLEMYITSRSPFNLNEMLRPGLFYTPVLDQNPLEWKKCPPISFQMEKPRKVFFNGTHTTLVWPSGEKTTVGVGPNNQYDEYAGFCAAIVKKMFGSSREAQKFLDRVKIVQKSKNKKEKRKEHL